MKSKFLVVLTLVLVLLMSQSVYAADSMGSKSDKVTKIDTSIHPEGSERIRYDNLTAGGSPTMKTKYSTEVGLRQTVNEHLKWQFNWRNETTFNSTKHTIDHVSMGGNSYINYKNAGNDYTYGRMHYAPAFGLIVNSEFNGLKATFNSKGKWENTVWYGKDRYLAEAKNYHGVIYPLSSDISGKEIESNSVHGFETSYKINDKWKFRGAIFQTKLAISGLQGNYNEYGIQYNFDKNLSASVIHGGSDAAGYNMANSVELNYNKNFNQKKPGTWRLRLANYHIEKLATIDCVYFRSTGNSNFEQCLDYVIAKDIVVRLNHAYGDSLDTPGAKFQGYHLDLNMSF